MCTSSKLCWKPALTSLPDAKAIHSISPALPPALPCPCPVRRLDTKQGSMAAFLACATSTLMIFGWSRAEAVEDCDGSHANGIFGAFKACTVPSTCVDNDSIISSASSCCSLLVYSVLGGVCGAVGEFLPLGVDDNLSMPLVSGTIFLFLHYVNMGMWSNGPEVSISHAI